MSKTMKRMMIGSMVVSGIVALAAIIDMIMGIPFSGKIVMDALFLISALVVIYLGFHTIQDMS